MTLLAQRFGCSPSWGGSELEEGLGWCAEHDFRTAVFMTDAGPNALGMWSEDRLRAVRRTCEAAGLRLVIHTLSAVNTAEFVPGMSEAVDVYLAANIDLAAGLGADVIVHAGLQFSERLEMRMHASLEHLLRAAELAEARGVVLLLENMNNEPEHAEVRYLGHNVEELRFFLDRIASRNVKWAFSANHARLVHESIDGFIDTFGVERLGIVMLSDNHGTVEEHLLPGQGDLDFARLFGRLEGAGYRGTYFLTFGPRDELLKGRDHILKQVPA